TNQTVTTEVGRLDAANQAQDVAVAQDQARQDALIAANEQSSIDRDTALSNTVAANDKAVNARIDSTNETMITEVSRLDEVDTAQKARNDKFAKATAEMLGAGASYNSESGTMLAPSYSIGGNIYNNVGDAFSATDARIDSLEGNYRELRSDMKELGYKLSAGIASNAAMEVAPFVPGKVSYAMGMSHFNGEAAIGGTLRHTSADGKVSMIGGFSTNTQQESLFKIGISGVID
ncbi:MAG: YadA-like family protein, partial [Pseudomonadota bacterium]|nr:YadA-like family protein [Pseudomonadota bacterium]